MLSFRSWYMLRQVSMLTLLETAIAILPRLLELESTIHGYETSLCKTLGCYSQHKAFMTPRNITSHPQLKTVIQPSTGRSHIFTQKWVASYFNPFAVQVCSVASQCVILIVVDSCQSLSHMHSSQFSLKLHVWAQCGHIRFEYMFEVIALGQSHIHSSMLSQLMVKL
jgi:hypothetical protein